MLEDLERDGYIRKITSSREKLMSLLNFLRGMLK